MKGKLDSYQHYRTFVDFCEVLTAGTQLADLVVDSWVKKGLDSDELVELGPKRAILFIERLAQSKPDLENPVFIMHLRSYVGAIRQQFQSNSQSKVKGMKPSKRPVNDRQARRLHTALSKFTAL